MAEGLPLDEDIPNPMHKAQLLLVGLNISLTAQQRLLTTRLGPTSPPPTPRAFQEQPPVGSPTGSFGPKESRGNHRDRNKSCCSCKL